MSKNIAILKDHGLDKVYLSLRSDINLDEPDDDGITPLMYALQNENMKLFNVLVKLGANINAKGSNGETLFFFAVKKELKDHLSYLIELGANADIRRDDGETPLTYAANTHDDFLKYSFGDFKLSNNNGDTPLIILCRKKAINHANVLVESIDCNINARNNKGETALYWAAVNSNSNWSLMKNLIYAGASISGGLLGKKEISNEARMYLAGASKYSTDEIIRDYKKILFKFYDKFYFIGCDVQSTQYLFDEISDFTTRLEFLCIMKKFNPNLLKYNEEISRVIRKIDPYFFESLGKYII
jgi:ankyrin repeat protein